MGVWRMLNLWARSAMMTKLCGSTIIAVLAILGQIDHTRGYCETFNNKPSIEVCQAGTVTGSLIYLDSDGAPDTGRVLCQCSLTHNTGTTLKIWASTAWNQKDGVEFEIEDKVFFNNTDQVPFDLLSSSVILFRKTLVSDDAALCIGLLPGDGVSNFTVTCSSTIQDLPSSTDAPTTTTTVPTTTTPAPTPQPTTELTNPTTQPTVPPTQPTVPSTQPTVPPTQPTVPPTQPTVPPIIPTTSTIQPPVTTRTITVTTLAQTVGSTAAGSGEDDGYTSNDDTIGIIIIVALAIGVLIVLIILLLPCCRNDSDKKSKKSKKVARISVESNEVFYSTTNPKYVSADKIMIQREVRGDSPKPEINAIVTQLDPPHVMRGSAEYSVVSFKGGRGEPQPYVTNEPRSSYNEEPHAYYTEETRRYSNEEAGLPDVFQSSATPTEIVRDETENADEAPIVVKMDFIEDRAESEEPAINRNHVEPDRNEGKDDVVAVVDFADEDNGGNANSDNGEQDGICNPDDNVENTTSEVEIQNQHISEAFNKALKDDANETGSFENTEAGIKY